MDHRRPPPTRNSSRTVAKVAVAVLIVIAIAGFVLAGLRSRAPVPEQAATDATPEAAAPLTAATAPAGSGAADSVNLPNQIAFASASATLSEEQAAKVRKLATNAQTKNHSVGILSKAEAGSSQFALAQQRTLAVRQTLEQSGVPLGRMTIEISQMPHGGVSAADANRVEVVMR
jgi:outer membrane protein OmpA-like peptidoglycan-associated protein